jgi:hypothetical protein
MSRKYFIFASTQNGINNLEDSLGRQGKEEKKRSIMNLDIIQLACFRLLSE